MKRNKLLFLKRKGSNLNCIDVEEVNENNNGILGSKNPDKLPVLSTATGYNSAEKLAARKENTFLKTSLHKSCPCTLKDVSWKGVMLSPKPSWAVADPAQDKRLYKKKKKKLPQEKYQLSTQTERILPQIKYTARILVDKQLDCENRKRVTSQKTGKKLHFRTKELSVLKALNPKEVSQVKTKREEKELTDEYYGSLAPKHIHQESFQKQIRNKMFPVLTKLSLVNNIKEQKLKVKEKVSFPRFPTKKDFLRAGRLYSKLSIQSDLKEVGQNCNDSNLPDADLALEPANVSEVSDIELEKPKVRTGDSKKELKKFNFDFSNSRKNLNSWALNEVQKVNTQECRSFVNDGHIEIFLPPI